MKLWTRWKTSSWPTVVVLDSKRRVVWDRETAEAVRERDGIALAASGDLYWSVGWGPDGGSIQTAPKSSDGGSTPRSLVTGLNGSSALILDAANVYWVAPGDVDQANGLVEYCPLTGCQQRRARPEESGNEAVDEPERVNPGLLVLRFRVDRICSQEDR